jgi:pyruvate dehydrogenase kinase 2/3/4
LTSLARPSLSQEIRDRLLKPGKFNGNGAKALSQTTQNPSVKAGQYRSAPEQKNGNGLRNGQDSKKLLSSRRYYVPADDGEDWPPELNAYNHRFAEALEKIKRRHDSVVTTVGKKWKST